MERLSFFQYLLQRFGAVIGALAVLASVGFYFNAETSAEDLKSIWLLQESKTAVLLAEREGTSYLSTGKNQDLDAYNIQILKIGELYKQLADSVRGAEEVQGPFGVVQTLSKNHFLSLNEKIQKKQSRAGKSQHFEVDLTEAKAIVTSLEALVSTLRPHGSKHLSMAGVDLSVAAWQLMLGLAFACYCLWMHQRSAHHATEKYNKEVSDLNIQSIILDGILNSISEAMIVVDERGQFTRYNSAAERIIGKKLKSIASEQDAADFGFFELESSMPVRLAELPFARALKGEQLEDAEFLVVNAHHPQGMFISVSSRYLSGLNGQIHGALVVFRDINRRKATEQEWLRARESALETARKKSDFLAAMSHEIRTPMNGVMGMSTLLADTVLSEEQSDYVGTIRRSAEALLRLINDILDHSKIEAGMVEINLRPFDLKVLCEDVLELFYPLVREKNVGLTLELLSRDEWVFLGDGGRVRQILVNLVGNAVKFTEQGQIKLQIQSQAAAGLRFSVIDTGPGFSHEESEFLFQKYFQTKAGMKYGGTGLGLSICHQLVELMGGKIGLTSEPNAGSTFWFEIQLPAAAADQIVSAKEHSFAPIFSGRVLLAEDQVINQRVAVTYLQKLGLQVDVANNGQVAVQKAQATAYDLIFMDCQMPVMTGYEATKKLREAQTGERTTIIALTAEGTSGERKTCIAMGMDDFLTKPLELEKLTEVLHRWLKTGPAVLDLKALEKLKSYVVNNKSLTDALIEDFLKTAPELTAEILAGLAANDLERISQPAHALKSCSATLGAIGLAELCQKLEDVTSTDEACILIEKLQEQVEISSRELQKHWTAAAA